VDVTYQGYGVDPKFNDMHANKYQKGHSIGKKAFEDRDWCYAAINQQCWEPPEGGDIQDFSPKLSERLWLY
jgi:hypothetical protein